MASEVLETLSDRITIAHTRLQQEFAHINPVVGVNRQMRSAGIPADAITIDCLRTNKRVLLVLHDQQPEVVHMQMGYRDQDPGTTFNAVAIDAVTEQQLYDWVLGYFGSTPES